MKRIVEVHFMNLNSLGQSQSYSSNNSLLLTYPLLDQNTVYTHNMANMTLRLFLKHLRDVKSNRKSMVVIKVRNVYPANAIMPFLCHSWKNS